MHIIHVFLAVIGCIITKPNQEIKVRENEEIKSIKQETKHFKKKINNAYEGLFEGLDYAKDIEEYEEEYEMLPEIVEISDVSKINIEELKVLKQKR